MRLSGRTSITRRLTLLFVAASSAVLLGLGFVIASAVEEHFEELDMEVLAGKMDLTRHALQMMGVGGDRLQPVDGQMDYSLMGHHGMEVLVLGSQQQVLFATPNAQFAAPLVTRQARQHPNQPALWPLNGRTYRGIASEVTGARADKRPLVVAVAIDMAHHQTFMQSFRTTLWWFVAGAAALSGLLGWVAARRGLAPLRAMGEQAQSVTAQQLSYRLPTESAPRELAELANTLNDMLARLEDAFGRLSDFSSDIAHELRTPVSNLMTQTQVALSKARSADEYRAILESNAEEFERMARMISDMLLLAKADNGLVVPHRETLDLAADIRKLFDFYDAVADEKAVRFELLGVGQISADRQMLRRALGNLLSNAVRHATPGSTVTVTLVTQADHVLIQVANAGTSIAPEHLERVFDRFFRVDPSRHRSSEGTGLGLAITQSIVLAHGGAIWAASDDAQTVFSVRLPTDL